MDRFGDKVCCNPLVKLKKGESYPLIDIDKITPGKRLVRGIESLEYCGQSGSKFEDHDVLFARITPCLENGKVAIADTDGKAGIGSTELFVFRGVDNVSDTNYVYYLLKTNYFRQLSANSMTGASGRQRADLDYIKRIKWDFPSIDKQKEIADVLLTYDELMSVNDLRIKKLEQMAENLFKEWFVRFRFPGHEKNGFENGIPKGWGYCTVESITSILQRGISPDYDDNGEFTVISQKCIRQNIMDIKEARKQAKPYKKELNLKDGDTVVCSTGTGTLGRVGQVFGDFPNTTFDSHVTLIRSNDQIGPNCLYWMLKELQPWFMNMGIGSTNQQELYRNTIKNAKMLLPSNEVAILFEKMIEPIHQQIVNLTNIQDNLIMQRDLLLPRLMIGQLKV